VSGGAAAPWPRVRLTSSPPSFALMLPHKGTEFCVKCVHCADERAEVTCHDCDDAYCHECFRALHMKGNRASHVKHPIDLCSVCSYQQATKMCATCSADKGGRVCHCDVCGCVRAVAVRARCRCCS